MPEHALRPSLSIGDYVSSRVAGGPLGVLIQRWNGSAQSRVIEPVFGGRLA